MEKSSTGKVAMAVLFYIAQAVAMKVTNDPSLPQETVDRINSSTFNKLVQIAK